MPPGEKKLSAIIGNTDDSLSQSSDVTSISTEKEVSFSDPTTLCRLIMAGKYKQASKRIWSHREESSTWICIQESSSKNDEDANQKKYTFRKLPIHIACGMLSNSLHPTKDDARLESLIIQFIVLHPLACTKPDHEGQLPIHEAIRRHASVRIIAMLLTAYPGSILHRDIYGRTPIHVNRSRAEGRINYVENALAKGVRFWEKAREQVKNPHAEDEMSMVKKTAPKSPVKRDDDFVLHHQEDFSGFTPRRGNGFVKQDGFTRTLKRISSATSASVFLEEDGMEEKGDENLITPEESADLAVSAIEDAVSDFFKKMEAFAREGEEADDSDEGDSADPELAKLERKIRKLERMLNESYSENNELVEALKGVNESYGKDKSGKDEWESMKEKVSSVDDYKIEDETKDEQLVNDDDIVHSSPSSENDYLKRKIKVKEEEIQYLQKELSRLRRSNAAYRQEVDRLLSEGGDGSSTTLSMIEDARKKAKCISNLHPNMSADFSEYDDDVFGGPIARSDGKGLSSHLGDQARSCKISAQALHLKLRLRFQNSIDLSEPTENGEIDAQADFDAILKALESTSQFSTERFLARKVQELKGKLNEAYEARKADAEIYMREMDDLLVENNMLKDKLSLVEKE